jgi:hypothetical protein
MDTFYKEIIKKEIEGKNSAIHEYDSMLWKLRIGFLSLYFAGWGLLFTTFMKIKKDELLLVDFTTIILTLGIITLVICAGGWRIDLNLSRRKYRVIHALDCLYEIIFKEGQKLNDPNLTKLIQTSGARSDKLYLKCNGYKKEMNVLLFVYGLPVLVMIIGLAILFPI